MPLRRLEGFDDSMAALAQPWNAPAIGVCVVVDGERVLTRGYGLREYESSGRSRHGEVAPLDQMTGAGRFVHRKAARA
ncbi:hypothetical protein H3V53_04865 [Paraburkholderia bengalensis]|uniref:Beta-lactamase n=1 Tax=Paraburkholderia bengalensis TaxID=2747562 RepID=A0ABU8ILT8_9BURK